MTMQMFVFGNARFVNRLTFYSFLVLDPLRRQLELPLDLALHLSRELAETAKTNVIFSQSPIKLAREN